YRQVLAKAEGGALEDLAKLALEPGFEGGLRVAGEQMVAQVGRGWPGRSLYAVCAELARSRASSALVLALARSGTATETVRLVAMDCLAERAELRDEMCRFRVGE